MHNAEFIKNKNRGAGLVTVVVVLAVSGILLSASMWLSFNHYQNVLNAENKGTEQAELDLCAELICLSLDQDAEMLLDFSNPKFALAEFYECENIMCTVWVDDLKEVGVLVRLHNDDDILIVPKIEGDLSKGATIIYYRQEEPIASKEYSFVESDGKYTVSSEVQE